MGVGLELLLHRSEGGLVDLHDLEADHATEVELGGPAGEDLTEEADSAGLSLGLAAGEELEEDVLGGHLGGALVAVEVVIRMDGGGGDDFASLGANGPEVGAHSEDVLGVPPVHALLALVAAGDFALDDEVGLLGDVFVAEVGRVGIPEGLIAAGELHLLVTGHTHIDDIQLEVLGRLLEPCLGIAGAGRDAGDVLLDIEGDAGGALQGHELLQGHGVVHVRISGRDLCLHLHVVDPVLAHTGVDDPVALHVAEGGGEDPVIIESEVAGLALAGDIDPSPEAHSLTQGIGEGLLPRSGRVPGSSPLGSDRRGVGGGEGERRNG